MDIEIKPIDRVVGEAEMPGDKSISHRAVMIGAISNGVTEARNFLNSEDCMATVQAFQKMEVKIDIDSKLLKVNGVTLRGLKKPNEDLYLGNSGTTMRLISGILAGQNFDAVLTGDESLSKRPMERIIEPLSLMGARLSSLNKNGCAPLKIKGKNKLNAINYKSKISSAQVKSCVLLAGLYADGTTTFEEPFQSRDHTERMLSYFGANLIKEKHIVGIKSGSPLSAKKIQIPSDISSAAFFIVLALILEGSEIEIKSVGINPTRRGIIDVLKRMAADIKIKNETGTFEPVCDLDIKASRLKSTVVREEEIPLLIDEIPILCVAAAQAEGVTEIRGAGELKVKETDRIFSMTDNLRKLGVDITSKNSNLVIKGRAKRFSPKGALELRSFGDHRTAMTMCVAAAASSGRCVVKDVDCINTSFPEFFDIFNYLKR